MFALLTISLVGSLLGSPSPPLEEVVEQDEVAVVEVEAEHVHRARYVLADFMKNEKRPDCYRILFSESKEGLRVYFVSKLEDLVSVQGEKVPPTTCPTPKRDIGFVIDQRGAILRRVHPR